MGSPAGRFFLDSNTPLNGILSPSQLTKKAQQTAENWRKKTTSVEPPELTGLELKQRRSKNGPQVTTTTRLSKKPAQHHKASASQVMDDMVFPNYDTSY